MIREKTMSSFLMCAVVSMFLLAFSGVYAIGEDMQEASADYVGSEMCATCHQDTYDSYKASIHVKTEGSNYSVHGCESCHGAGGEHIQAPSPLNIFTYKAEDISSTDKTKQCMECHSQNKNNCSFIGSDHMKGAVTCADCHKPHAAAGKDKLLTKEGYKLCLECHKEIGNKLKLNEHHRIVEGVVRCTDCHDTHKASPRSRLGGFKNEVCFKCHTDKQGPFVYEHGSVKVEGCTACHDPHGSVNRHMLLQQSTANLCFSCHADAPSFHTRFNPTTNCTNCHSSIHGSQLDDKFLK